MKATTRTVFDGAAIQRLAYDKWGVESFVDFRSKLDRKGFRFADKTLFRAWKGEAGGRIATAGDIAAGLGCDVGEILRRRRVALTEA